MSFIPSVIEKDTCIANVVEKSKEPNCLSNFYNEGWNKLFLSHYGNAEAEFALWVFFAFHWKFLLFKLNWVFEWFQEVNKFFNGDIWGFSGLVSIIQRLFVCLVMEENPITWIPFKTLLGFHLVCFFFKGNLTKRPFSHFHWGRKQHLSILRRRNRQHNLDVSKGASYTCQDILWRTKPHTGQKDNMA